MRTRPKAEVQFSYSQTFKFKPQRAAARLIESMSGQRRLEKLYEHYRAHPRPGESFWDAAVRLLLLRVRHDDGRLAAIPASGPLVILANHPFGVVDGLVLGSLIGRTRPDFRLLVHGALYQAPEAIPHLLPIDFSGGREAARNILRSRAEALAHLKGGGCLIVFPAGAVTNTPSILARHAVDGEWGPFSAKLIRRAKATIVLFHFAGQNSSLFQLASHLSYTVRVSLLFHETARRIGSEVVVRIGRPITASELAGANSDEALIAMLRSLTDRLAEEDAPPTTTRGSRRSRSRDAGSQVLRPRTRRRPMASLLRAPGRLRPRAESGQPLAGANLGVLVPTFVSAAVANFRRALPNERSGSERHR